MPTRTLPTISPQKYSIVKKKKSPAPADTSVPQQNSNPPQPAPAASTAEVHASKRQPRRRPTKDSEKPVDTNDPPVRALSQPSDKGQITINLPPDEAALLERGMQGNARHRGESIEDTIAYTLLIGMITVTNSITRQIDRKTSEMERRIREIEHQTNALKGIRKLKAEEPVSTAELDAVFYEAKNGNLEAAIVVEDIRRFGDPWRCPALRMGYLDWKCASPLVRPVRSARESSTVTTRGTPPGPGTTLIASTGTFLTIEFIGHPNPTPHGDCVLHDGTEHQYQ